MLLLVFGLLFHCLIFFDIFIVSTRFNKHLRNDNYNTQKQSMMWQNGFSTFFAVRSRLLTTFIILNAFGLMAQFGYLVLKRKIQQFRCRRLLILIGRNALLTVAVWKPRLPLFLFARTCSFCMSFRFCVFFTLLDYSTHFYVVDIIDTKNGILFKSLWVCVW